MSLLKVADVCAAVAAQRRMPSEVLLRRKRSKRFTPVRHLAMALARDVTGRSLSEIARFFDCHHATILYAVYKITERNGLKESSKDDYDRLRLAILVYDAQRVLSVQEWRG
jgi:chromosomal replication initiation ATPase DnaA